MKTLLITLIASFALVSNAYANWSLVKEESTITFTSIKKETVAEVHTFEEFAGQVLDDGKAYLDINLASAQTNIEIRNQRLSAMLFETEKFAGARVVGMIDVKKAQALAVGQIYSETIKMMFDLHGFKKEIEAVVTVSKLMDNKIQVASVKPVIINAGDYGLAEGVEALRKVANLPSISLVVPVTFNLVFVK